MATKFFAATITTAGVPQQLSTITSPASIIAKVSMNGAAAQPLTETAYQIVITADSANTGNVFIGGPGMVVSTRVGVGAVLAKGIQISLDHYGGQLTLDDLWVDTDVSGSKLLVTLVG
jgi:hypothetical protein